MKERDLKKIAEKVLDLERACHRGEYIPENMTKMNMLMDPLEPEELFKLVEILEEKTCKDKKFLV